MVKNLDRTYTKADLKHVFANTIQLNAEEKTQLLGLIKDFEYFFDVTIGEWDTEPVYLELSPNSKPFNCKHYLVPRINKDRFHNAIKHLVEI